MTQTPQHPPMTYEQLQQSHDEWRMLAMHNYGVAKSAEAREQRLKDAVTEALSWTWDCAEGNMLEVREALSKVLSTLYPDTPAPTNEEE
ncbi:hypothetical protein [Paenibacillus sp. S150]|uniref:hypothetical protein n=1 Tax=Paenibacillus sp. S150 TaxID=2749826 RepID=UPI001C55AF3E|nr:hypothetical protein [Paenibacillus sp. S150]MBW4083602.1 hypothetical protein [Paenibacillus sp. S150]